MQFIKRIFGRQDREAPDPLHPAVSDEERQREHRIQRENRALMEAEVARDRERRGISAPDTPPSADDQ